MLATISNSLWKAAPKDETKIELEPFGHIINLWLRVFLKDGAKPAVGLSAHHITWDPSKRVWGSSFDSQGMQRWLSSEITDHVKIIEVWEAAIESALSLHFPVKVGEDPFHMIHFFQGAIEGLELVKDTYTNVPAEDKSPRRIQNCIKLIETAIKAAGTEEGYLHNRESLPLTDKTRALWDKNQHLIVAVYNYFMELKKTSREENGFQSKVDSIANIVAERSIEFDKILNSKMY